MNRALGLVPPDRDSTQSVVEALSRTLQRVVLPAREFDAEDLFNNESQLSAAFIAEMARSQPAWFEFNAKLGATRLVANFPFHNYEASGKKKVRFADYALLDIETSSRGRTRAEPATHNASAFIELKYHFIPGPFRGSSPLRDLERLEKFRAFNSTERKPEGVLGVGFRWSKKSGDRERDGGAVTSRFFDRQERTFRALRKRLESGRESGWATLVYLDYHEPGTGFPEVRAMGLHADAARRAVHGGSTRRVPVSDSRRLRSKHA